MPSTVHKQQNDWPMARKCDQKIHLQYSNGQFPKSSLSFLYGSLFLKIFFFLYCAVRTVNYSNRFVPCTVHKQQNDWPMARKCDQKIHLQYSNGQFPKSSLAFLYRSLFYSFEIFSFLYCAVCTVDYSSRFVSSTVHKQQNDWPMARKCDQKIHLQYSNGQFPKSSLAFLYHSLFLKYFSYCTVQYVL